jgi:hypothetical protein
VRTSNGWFTKGESTTETGCKAGMARVLKFNCIFNQYKENASAIKIKNTLAKQGGAWRSLGHNWFTP